MWILGLDQGSTETRAAVCDGHGQVVGFGKSFGACHSITGMQPAMQAVTLAAQAALTQAGVSPGQVDLLFGGLTGADWPDEYQLLTHNLLNLGLARQVRVVNDSLIALRGGTQASYGVIVIAGTGANCAIRSPEGHEFIYHYYVEEALQGGVGLGRSVLAAIYRSATGRELETSLTPAVLQALGFPSVDALLRAQVEHRLSQDQVKGLAPLLYRIAQAGDPVAQEILRAFGVGLASLVTAGLQRYSMIHLDVEVVVSGSIFKAPGAFLQTVMAAEIRKIAPGARLVDARYEPVAGALILGLETAGISIDKRIRSKLEQGCQRFNLIRIP